MRLACLLLFFLLHLSASTCGDATSRNPRTFLDPGGADVVGAPSPAIHDHRHIVIAKDLFHYDAHYPYAMMGRRGATPPPLRSSHLRQPPDKEITTSGAATMALSSPSSSPRVGDNGGYFGEPGGEADFGGGNGGEGSGPPPPSEASATEHPEESSAGDDVGFDYEAPKTHPPSHN